MSIFKSQESQKKQESQESQKSHKMFTEIFCGEKGCENDTLCGGRSLEKSRGHDQHVT
jgi:hypothetical protein